ncbi:MAG TPA: serine/threonine protein kinase [Nannocystis exedens]|nr:serine/threonine protein kinase [Nannocystis exedens]
MRGPRRTSEDSWIGKTLDERYKIQEVFSATESHTVFVALHLRLRKQVAIKIIQQAYASDGEVAARFSREANAGAQFDHPNVVGIIDCGRLADGRTYLVTEMVRGPTLREFLDEHGRMHWTLACDIGSQLSEALIAAHAVGIVHRDINPDNLRLEIRDDGSYWIKITSFGIARMTGNALVDPSHELGSTLTRQGMILGTAGYMSPEQAIGEEVDESADAYALGAVLWECINGRPLWVADSVEDALAQQLHHEPALFDAFEDGPVPEILQSLILQLLARDPRGRPALIDPVSPTLRKLAHGSEFEDSQVTAMPEISASDPQDFANSGGFPFEAERGGTVVDDSFVFPGGPAGKTSMKAVFGQLADVLKALWRSASTGTRVILAMISLSPVILIVVALMVGGSSKKSEPSEPETVATPEVQEVVPPEPETPTEPEEAESEARAPAIPAELEVAVKMLFGADVSKKEREAGATKIRSYEPEDALPVVVRASATLVLERKCKVKKAIINRLRELDAIEAMPVLLALDGDRKSCGKRKRRKDCYPCLREDLARTLGRFEVLIELRDQAQSP